MRAIVQRVNHSKVEVNNNCISSIDKGFLVLLGVDVEDTKEDADYIVKKLLGLRIFEDEEEKMNLSIEDIGGSFQIVSQFTLLGDARKGRRPSFIKAARPKQATELYEYVCTSIEDLGHDVKKGAFGEHMLISLQNDGPVTILLDSKRTF